MALDALIAKANVGTGTDALAGRSTANGFVGAAMLTDSLGNEVTTANPLPVELTPLQEINYSQTGAIAINTDLMVIDCADLRGLMIQCTSMGTSGVVTAAWSNNNSIYPTSATLMTPAGINISTFSGAGLWTTPIYGRYLRLRLTTAATAGTTAIVVQGTNMVIGQPVTQPISGTVSISGAPTLGAGTNLAADFGVQYRTNATGAAALHHVVSSAGTNAAVVKASAGRVVGWTLVNTSVVWQFVKLHNQATSPTAGAGVVMTLGIPPGGVLSNEITGGIGFSTGIARTIVTDAADTGTTATTANAVVGDIYFA